ncbi:MAG: GerMN domain-containing protein [Acidimicrobiales bacterium]
MTPAIGRGHRRLAVGVALLAGASLAGTPLAGCAIPEDSKPQAVERVSLPPQLVDPPSTTVPQPASETETRSVYLVKAATSPDGTDSLQPVRTQVRVPSDPADAPRAVIDQLLRLPTAEQKSLGLRSDIPSTVRVRSVTADPASGVLTVDLSGLGQVEGPKQRLAAAQIVFTATELPGISAVRFEIDGEPATIPLDDRTSAASQPITRQDFPKLNQLLGGSTTSTTAAPTTLPAPTPGG